MTNGHDANRRRVNRIRWFVAHLARAATWDRTALGAQSYDAARMRATFGGAVGAWLFWFWCLTCASAASVFGGTGVNDLLTIGT